MTAAQWGILVDALKAAYSMAGFLATDAAISMWYTMLRDVPYEPMAAAVKTWIMTEKWPPTIADLRSRAEAVSTRAALTDAEAWDRVQIAMRDALWNAPGQFAKLPPVVQAAVGSPGALKEWAAMPAEKLQSAVKARWAQAYKDAVTAAAGRSVIGITEKGESA